MEITLVGPTTRHDAARRPDVTAPADWGAAGDRDASADYSVALEHRRPTDPRPADLDPRGTTAPVTVLDVAQKRDSDTGEVTLAETVPLAAVAGGVAEVVEIVPVTTSGAPVVSAPDATDAEPAPPAGDAEPASPPPDPLGAEELKADEERPAKEAARVPAARTAWQTGASPVTLLKRDAIFRRGLICADLAAAALALVLGVTLSHAQGLYATCVPALAAVVLTAKLLRLYDRDELVFHKATLDEAPSLFYLASLFALGVWFLHEWLMYGPVGRLTIGIVWVSFAVSVVATRSVARALARRFAPAERCIIAGPAGPRERMAKKIFSSQVGTEVVGYLPLEDERQQAERRKRPRWETADRRVRDIAIEHLDELADELQVHRIVIVPGRADSDTMAQAISRANRAGVKVSILPRMFETVGSSVEFDEFEGLTVLGVRRFGLSRSSRAIKRAMDIVCSAVGLIVTAPLFVLIGLAIRLDSDGPVFFRQVRVGRADACFEMLKFRSMVDGAHAQRAALRRLNESEGLFKLREDPRVTRIGRFLRRTSLDELPQLINVLRGDMSLVGPRPLILEEDESIEGHYRGRLELAPGITGPWQLLGPTRVPLREMVNMDYLYGANWSVWTDIKVMLRTVAYVFGRRGM